jgi:hypothetical protein
VRSNIDLIYVAVGNFDSRFDPYSLEVLCVALHEQSDNETKQSKNGSEDLDGKDLDEPGTWSVTARMLRDDIPTLQGPQHRPALRYFR